MYRDLPRCSESSCTTAFCSAKSGSKFHKLQVEYSFYSDSKLPEKGCRVASHVEEYFWYIGRLEDCFQSVQIVSCWRIECNVSEYVDVDEICMFERVC